MIIPVRCYTCGKVTGNKWDHYNDLLNSGKTQPEAFEILNLKRYCCKRILLGNVDIMTTLMSYDPNYPKHRLYNLESLKETNPTTDENNVEESEPLFN
jgi:DNA-directed RNA polymerase I, II, and III subunit RPABC5